MPRFECPLRERKRLFFRVITLGCIGLCLAVGLCQVVFAQKDAELDFQACIVYHGEPILIPTGDVCVTEMLDELGLPIQEDDRLSRKGETVLRPGDMLRVDCIQRVQQTYTVPVPREMQHCMDDTLPPGGKETILPGRDGELLRTAEVTYINGKETHREVLKEQVLIPPVNGVVAHGRSEMPEDPGPQIDDNTIRLPTGETLTYTHTAAVRATAYTHTDKGCNMVTATGSRVHVGTVAVDPRKIPYGTRMFIVASDGSYIYGIAEAEDCGGDIIGDRMDLYLPTYEDCMEFGRRVCTVYFLG